MGGYPPESYPHFKVAQVQQQQKPLKPLPRSPPPHPSISFGLQSCCQERLAAVPSVSRRSSSQPHSLLRPLSLTTLQLRAALFPATQTLTGRETGIQTNGEGTRATGFCRPQMRLLWKAKPVTGRCPAETALCAQRDPDRCSHPALHPPPCLFSSVHLPAVMYV